MASNYLGTSTGDVPLNDLGSGLYLGRRGGRARRPDRDARRDAAGTGRITARGKGASLPMPALPLAVPVRVQLRRSGASTCWEAAYTSAALRNDAQQFRARTN